MKIAYIYPEKLPSSKARTISVMNSLCALSKYVDTSLIYEKSASKAEILDFYSLNCNCTFIPLSKKMIFRSNKIFNYNLKKVIHKFDFFYVRHLKTAKYLIENGAKVIFESHEIFQINNRDMKEIEDFVYQKSQGIVFVNGILQSMANKFFKIIIPQTVIRNGCGFEVDFIEKDFTKIDEIYYIGNFYPWKGVDFLIEAMKDVNVKLKIVGDGERKAELLTYLETNHIDNVEFLGYLSHPQVKEILKNAKLTVIPNIPTTDSEFSAPIKLYEYLMTSNIVLASDMDTIKEIVEDEKNGFLFKAGDLNDFIKMMKYILNLPTDTLKEISYEAYQTGIEFTWDNRAKKIIDFMKSL